MSNFLRPSRWWVRDMMEALTRPWFINRGQELDWVVYEQATNQSFHVDPPTHANAVREAAYFQTGHMALPLIVVREMKNAYNHGRASVLRPRVTK